MFKPHVQGHVQDVNRCGVGSHGLSGPFCRRGKRWRCPLSVFATIACASTRGEWRMTSQRGLVMVLDGVNDLDLRSSRALEDIITTWLNTSILIKLNFYSDKTYSAISSIKSYITLSTSPKNIV